MKLSILATAAMITLVSLVTSASSSPFTPTGQIQIAQASDLDSLATMIIQQYQAKSNTGPLSIG